MLEECCIILNRFIGFLMVNSNCIKNIKDFKIYVKCWYKKLKVYLVN